MKAITGKVTMEIKKETKEKPKKSQSQGSCETCEFYEEDYGQASCTVSLDEDEFADFAAKNTGSCPYYRYYDEYKTVRKQN